MSIQNITITIKVMVDKFLEEYKLSADYVNANVDEVSTLVEKYGITKPQLQSRQYLNAT